MLLTLSRTCFSLRASFSPFLFFTLFFSSFFRAYILPEILLWQACTCEGGWERERGEEGGRGDRREGGWEREREGEERGGREKGEGGGRSKVYYAGHYNFT